jgi:DNA polymerase-2
MQTTTGWLFDLYPLGDRMVLWFITRQGERLRLQDEFPYLVYLAGPRERLARLAQAFQSRRWIRRHYRVQGRDLWSDAEIDVLALELRAYSFLPRLQACLGKLKEELGCYNCDLDVSAYYLYFRGLQPCAWYDLEIEAGRLLAIQPREEPFSLELSLPPLSVLHVGLTRDPLIPLGAGNGLFLSWDDRTLELEVADRASLVKELARILKRLDPDLVVSDWGDEEIIPPLWRWSRDYQLSLPLDRETAAPPRRFSGGRSYFSYGKIVYQGPSAPFFGRWHVDRMNSFFWREAGLAGLVQISRLGQIPLQQAARTSPGTLITSMQLARAVADGFLIPWRKGEPERFKNAEELLVIDKGGLVFMPPIGLHFNVAELDFASMYSTIMTIHNISPETVNCGCCRDFAGEGAKGRDIGAKRKEGEMAEKEENEFKVFPPASHPPALPSKDLVPEANYRLCRRREGLVPRTLRPILSLRERLKTRAKELPPELAVSYQERQNALKWMLVTCFGYLGYKNARFGRIEAHEAVTAYGRDKLLAAKEISETAGFQVLHALTDCLWIKKDGMTVTELEELCRDISSATGVRLSLEGWYHWIVFPASRQNPERPVATRYFGVFSDGSLKVRGLICRRRDTAPLVRRAQEALLKLLTTAATPPDLAALKPELEELAEGFRQRLREGGINPRELVVTRVLTRAVEDYRVDTPTVLAARQLARAGVHVVPGEKVRFVHREKRGPKEMQVQAAPFLDDLETYDTGIYLELLGRAIEEVMEGVFGGEQVLLEDSGIRGQESGKMRQKTLVLDPGPPTS